MSGFTPAPKALELDGLQIERGLIDSEAHTLRTAWEELKARVASPGRPGGPRREGLFIYGRLEGPIGSLYRHPLLLAFARQVFGSDIALYMNRILVKDVSFFEGVHLHQDMSYFNGGVRKLSVFVPLGAHHVSNGGLAFVRGSHRLGLLETRDTIDIAAHPEHEIVSPTLSCGDVVFADTLTWHLSNRSPTHDERPMLQIIYQPADGGSYFPASVPQPTLVCGTWRTEHFEPLSDGLEQSLEEGTGDPTQGRLLACATSLADLEVRIPVLNKRARLRELGPKGARWMQARLRGRPGRAAGPDSASVRRCLEERGVRSVRFCFSDSREIPRRELDSFCDFEIQGWLQAAYPGQEKLGSFRGLSVQSVEELCAGELPDAVVVVDRRNFPGIMRLLEPVLRRDCLVVPMGTDLAVPRDVQRLDSQAAMERSTPLRYLAVSGMRGSFAEFGTFWGRAFFESWFEYRHWLKGRFYAFDSFAGLSDPSADERRLSSGDFSLGAYACNVRSFECLADAVEMPAERRVIVPGFFDRTLVGRDPAAYGLEPESVSVCRIDCDILEPTRQVLDFVYPLLERGALLYFDDWRLCRASPDAGERAAALQWQQDHPDLELVEFHRDDWQHQWFIFQRRAT